MANLKVTGGILIQAGLLSIIVQVFATFKLFLEIFFTTFASIDSCPYVYVY